jgi:hypothetical protein
MGIDPLILICFKKVLPTYRVSSGCAHAVQLWMLLHIRPSRLAPLYVHDLQHEYDRHTTINMYNIYI